MPRDTYEVLLGGGGLLYLLWSLIQGITSNGWPTTEGKILWSSTRNRYGGESLPWGWRRSIAYRYQVAGVTYTSRRVYVGMRVFELWKGKAQELVHRYPTSAKVQVYYDPSKPSRSVLEPGAQLGSTLFYATLCALFLWGGLRL